MNSISISHFNIALLIALATIHLTHAEEALKQRVAGPLIEYTAADLNQCSDTWLQIKFAESMDVSLMKLAQQADHSFHDKSGKNLENVNRLVAEAVEINPTFSGDRNRFKTYKAVGQARSGEEGPDLGLWFNVRFDTDRTGLAEKLNMLNQLEVVEIAHPVPECEPACIASPLPLLPFGSNTPDFTDLQGYLYDPPFGLNAPAAWAMNGGRGRGVKFIDVERGWYRDHEDFDPETFFFDGMDSNNTNNFDHGTAVLGEVIGMNNDFGIVGFASDARWGTVAYPTGDHPFVSDNFIEAAEALEPGDVWLIEIQMFPGGLGATPMEYLQVNYDAIWTSSFALDVICVEAGANGSQNLDSGAFNGLFDRNVRDSGAILVAAGRPDSLTAEGFSNYGSRMDAHAWGSSIVTTGYGDLQNSTVNQDYTASFGGTSGASPMLVGTVLCLQGIHKANSGSPMLPLEVRSLIANTGTPHTDATREIGPRPNIAAAIDALPPICILGDLNGDKVVSLLDVEPFVDAIGSGEYICESDINQDGVLDLLDIGPFITLLSGK